MTMGHRKDLCRALPILAGALLVVGLALPAAAPGAGFPEKGRPVTHIVAYPPGGGTDVTARLLAPLLEKELGTPVQVLNKPGAGGQVGFTELSRSRPDGHTIGNLILPTVITTYLDPQRKAVFSRKSFQLLALQDNDPGIIAVKADGPYKNLKDLIDAAKAKPGTIRTTTSGILSDDHIAAMITEEVAGVKFAVVHFDGSAPGRTAVLGGHVEAFYGNVSEMEAQVRSGEMRLLAVMDRQRTKFYPDLKTAEEQGYKIYSGVHRGIGMPAGAPKEVVDALAGALAKVIPSEEFKGRMEKLTYAPMYMDPQKYAAFWVDYEAQATQWVEWAKAREK
jgi:tripartite-type tricarboxylate transporter receptor subunit TctC